jgi:hypothetical protein
LKSQKEGAVPGCLIEVLRLCIKGTPWKIEIIHLKLLKLLLAQSAEHIVTIKVAVQVKVERPKP